MNKGDVIAITIILSVILTVLYFVPDLNPTVREWMDERNEQLIRMCNENNLTPLDENTSFPKCIRREGNIIRERCYPEQYHNMYNGSWVLVCKDVNP